MDDINYGRFLNGSTESSGFDLSERAIANGASGRELDLVIPRILIVEDSQEIGELVELNLRKSGFEVIRVTDGEAGLKRALEEDYSLVILDIMLPKLDGLEVCKQLRAQKDNVPVMMLTARNEEIDKVIGLELGADDYLAKPFGVRELDARVKALLRRSANRASEQAGAKEKLEYGELLIDLIKRTVAIGGRMIDLSVTEFDLLVYMASHPGRAFTRGQLLKAVWGYDFAGYEHTVNSCINRLRAKVEAKPNAPQYVKTVWGHGYRFADAEEFEQV